jgi:hypothetical protein
MARKEGNSVEKEGKFVDKEGKFVEMKDWRRKKMVGEKENA